MRSIRDFKADEAKDRSAIGGETLREEMQSVAAKYAGKSEEELVKALRQNVSAARKSGAFSAEQIESFVRFVSPSLDEPMRKRLNELLLMIEAEDL